MLWQRVLTALVLVPLVVGGDTVGALSIACRRNQRSWTDADVDDKTLSGLWPSDHASVSAELSY